MHSMSVEISFLFFAFCMKQSKQGHAWNKLLEMNIYCAKNVVTCILSFVLKNTVQAMGIAAFTRA